MSIVVMGLSPDLLSLDFFLVPPDAPHGYGTVDLHVPEGSVWEIRADEQEDLFPESVHTTPDRDDACVQVTLRVEEPNDFILIAYLTWKEERRTIRVRASEGFTVVLDGTSKHVFDGYALSASGGPEKVPGWRPIDNGD